MRLRCEYAENPVGIDDPNPRLSWTLAGRSRGQHQSAWQILAASSQASLAHDRGDLWDSGKVPSDETLHIRYAGKALASSQKVFWKLRVWDKDDRVSQWSPPATWTMGVLHSNDWQAAWICAP